jgi:predicted DNA-binding mobile mystery protein A
MDGRKMQASMRDSFRRELDAAMLPLRLARKPKGKGKKGWVRSVREATGIPVEELARRLGVCRWEIRRLELAEEDSRIQLGTLRRAAEGVGCELVYGLVPKEGTLEDLAAAQTRVREEALAQRREARQAAKEPFLEFIGWRDSLWKAMRTMLRRNGYRMRPVKTDRGVAQEMALFERNVKLLKMAGMLGPFMKEFMEEEERAKRGRERAI